MDFVNFEKNKKYKPVIPNFENFDEDGGMYDRTIIIL